MGTDRENGLLYAIRWPVLGRYLGQLALVLVLLTLTNVVVSLYYGEYPISVRYLTIIALLAAAGWPLSRLQAPDRIQGLVVLSWLIFLAHGYPALDALFEVVSATGAVGLSTGITGNALPAFLKLVLCLDMLAGRLEIVALLVTLYPVTWMGRKRET